MTTTLRTASVTITDIAGTIAELLLQPRRIYLRHRAPRARRVHQLRRDIAAGRAKPIEMVLAVSTADLEDGVPLSLVLQAYQAIVSELTEYDAKLRADRTRDDGPLLPLVQAETRAQSALDVAEQGLLANPDSVAAIDTVLQRSAEYDAKQDHLVERLRTRRSRLTSNNREIAAI